MCLRMREKEGWVQQIECLSVSCPLDYQIDTDYKDLHPAGQPQANPYLFIDIGAQPDLLRERDRNMYAKVSALAAFEGP
jgi:hypothetical protein